MEEFLNRSRTAIKSEQNGQYLVVSGNEACDLDSTTCALAYAYFKQLQLGNALTIVPLCNTNRDDMPLRTEVVHWLRQCGLSWEALIYADDLFGPQANFCKHNKTVHLILVDCHDMVGCLHGRSWQVKEVIDHHMLHLDSSAHNLDNCELKRIDAVGSCATLVAAQILSDRRGELLPLALWKLLYGAILLDTVGLSDCGRQAGRLTDLDLLMASRIEDMIGEKIFSAGLSRETLFRGLENAKFDIKGLCIWDLLRRDTKLAVGPKNSGRSIVCSTIFGMDFEQLIRSADFTEAAKRICILQSAVVFVGITVGYAPSGHTISNSNTMHNGRVNRRKGLVVFAPNECEQEFCKQLADHLTRPSSKLDLQTVPCEPYIPGVVFTGVIRDPTATRKAVLPALVHFLQTSSSSSPPNPAFDSNNDGGASGIVDNADNSAMHPGSGSYPRGQSNNACGTDHTLLTHSLDCVRQWLSKLEMSERVELVKTCILQVVHDDSPDETTFHPIGILSANVLKQVTDKLFLLMSSHKKPEGADENASSMDKQLATTCTPESPKALSSIGIALNRGRRLTMPASNELKSYHRANLTKGVCSKHSSPKHRASDDSCSLLHRENVKPDWLETEYLTHLPALFPDRLTSRSIDAVEGVSYRLYRRLSAFPRTTQSKSPSSSTDCLESIDELRGSTTIEDEAELALLKVSFGDLNQIGGGVLSTDANTGRLSVCTSWPSTHPDAVMQRCLECLQHSPQFQQASFSGFC
ncbi:hypothetical protein EG68_00665 [Paragonimus skrjabini miyazakii]|uniref:DHHA2 domain-containing protein n=1 Tax=Paragonimus skrjabini miyazakii TaxID=59628 RepID=A0A8S9Z9Y4_9TREM|nr:hypothetical protein EG68_00665 [Paragonimus skrjabini miyazakii]